MTADQGRTRFCRSSRTAAGLSRKPIAPSNSIGGDIRSKTSSVASRIGGVLPPAEMTNRYPRHMPATRDPENCVPGNRQTFSTTGSDAEANSVPFVRHHIRHCEFDIGWMVKSGNDIEPQSECHSAMVPAEVTSGPTSKNKISETIS